MKIKQVAAGNGFADPKTIRYGMITVTILAVAFLVWAAYPSKFYFLNDDFIHIPLAAKGNFIFGSLVRPVGDLSLWFDNKIWGKDSFGYHLTNIIIHFGNVILVYFFSKALLTLYTDGKNLSLKSWSTAVIFLVYAFHSEPVLWIIGRSGSLSVFFFLFACIFYLKRKSGLIFFLISLLAFIAALLTYESSWVFPLFGLLISYTDVRLKINKWKTERVYPLVTIAIFSTFLFCLKNIAQEIFPEYSAYNFVHLNLPRLFLNYHSLLARTYLPYLNNSAIFAVIYCCTIAIGISFILFLKKQKRLNPLLWIATVLFLFSPLPEVSLGISTHNSESERYVYLPSVFFILLFVEIMFRVINNKIKFMLVTTLYIFLQCCLFNLSAIAYNFAGNVVRKSLDSINTHSSVKVIYLINRPIQYKGALMFRTGFENALNWICPGMNYTRIDTVSEMLYARKGVFKVYELSLEDGVNAIGCTLTSRNNNNFLININGKSFSFDQGKDMIMCWNDSSFIRTR
jgi:hypothetical protein